MFDLSVYKTFSIGGKSFSHQQTISKNGLEAFELSIPIAWAGTLSTRTDNNTGVLTMDDADHEIDTAEKVDLYWTNDDGTTGQRRNMTVGTVATTTVPIDLGSGDNLPALDLAVIACVPVVIDPASVTGDQVYAFVAAADARAQIVLMSTGSVEELAIHLPASQIYEWITGNAANPITGDVIDEIRMSMADTVTVQNVRIAFQMI
jgi:hypothetical protein